MALPPVVPINPALSPDWWRPEVRAAREAEAAAEAARVADYYAKQKAIQESNK
jgi:hypothetical protein